MRNPDVEAIAIALLLTLGLGLLPWIASLLEFTK